jgi:hypothetical protein
MENTIQGWVIIASPHPRSEKDVIHHFTFGNKRTDVIQEFTEKSSKSWRWWKRNYNLKCVRAESVIILKQ